MSRSAPAPPPPDDWSPPVPTDGPLGSGAAQPVVPVMATPPTAAPSRTGRKVVGAVVAIAVLAGIAYGVKTVVLDKGGEAPNEAEVDAAFTEVSGFKYTELPPDTVEQAQQFIDSNPEAAEAIGSFDIRQVSQGGTPVGAVLIFGVDPDVMGDAFEEGFTTGFQSTAGDVGLTKKDVDGVEVLSVTMPLGAGNMFFDRDDGLIFFVQGNDQSVTDKLTSGLIKGNF
jgi:hypothetical protein